MDEAIIEAFLREMRERHGDEIDGVVLPDGTREYVTSRVAGGDVDTLLFMLKLGYLMGLQTGYAVGSAGEDAPTPDRTPGPLQA